MGFRMRKSKTIVPGVRISTTGKSASISFGGKAGRVTVNSSGRVTKTAHVPGTNVSYVSSSGGSHTAGHSSGKVSHAATKKYDSTKLVYIDPADFAEMSTPDFLAYSDAFLTAAKNTMPETNEELDRARAQVEAITAETDRRVAQKQDAAHAQPAVPNPKLAKYSDKYLRNCGILMAVVGALLVLTGLLCFAGLGLFALVFIVLGVLCFCATSAYNKEIKLRHTLEDK